MSTAERTAMGRPTYPQGHPAMAVARNIVNAILDEAKTDVRVRQAINDDCDQFVAWLVEQYAVDRRA
jgi:transposase